MKHVEVHDTRIPALGLGTWQLRGDDCRRAVEQALEIGYRSIDTAQAYENEAQVGAAVEASGIPRQEVFLTTKIWPDDLTGDPGVVDGSLERLRTDHVDLLLVHWPNETLAVEQMLAPLVAALEAGKTRLVGVSNFPSAMFRAALEAAPVACNQVEYHPFLGQRRVLEVAREHGVMVTAYSPLARGAVKEDETLVDIGRRHGKSSIQVTLRWLLQQEGVTAVPKASSKEHLASNFDIFDFELTPEEMQRIHGLAHGMRLIDPGFAPAWDPA